MPFHVGGHKPEHLKTRTVTIWARLAGRLSLTVVGVLMIFFGYSRIEKGLHFGVDRYGGITDPRGLMLTGVTLALLAWIPDRLVAKALTQNTKTRTPPRSKKSAL